MVQARSAKRDAREQKGNPAANMMAAISSSMQEVLLHFQAQQDICYNVWMADKRRLDSRLTHAKHDFTWADEYWREADETWRIDDVRAAPCCCHQTMADVCENLHAVQKAMLTAQLHKSLAIAKPPQVLLSIKRT